MRTHYDGRDYLAVQNSQRRAAWAWRWHLQGGSQHIAARDLQDLRSSESIAHWMALQDRAAALRGAP